MSQVCRPQMVIHFAGPPYLLGLVHLQLMLLEQNPGGFRSTFRNGLVHEGIGFTFGTRAAAG